MYGKPDVRTFWSNYWKSMMEGTSLKLEDTLHVEIMQARKQWNYIVKILKEKCQCRIKIDKQINGTEQKILKWPIWQCNDVSFR